MSADENARDDAPSAAREAAVAVTGLVVAALVVSGWSLGFHLDNAHNGLLGLSFTAVGLYVVRMRPRHLEGVLFVAVGILHAVMFFGRQYGAHDRPLPDAEWIGWVGVWPLPLAIALVAWTLMAFPDGRLLSPRWRLAVCGMMAVAFALSLVSALWPVDYDRTALVAPHPLDVPGADRAQTFWDGARVCFLLFQVLWTAAILARVHRARGDEARQLRWLVYSVVVEIGLLAGGLTVVGSPVPGLLALPLVPVAAGIAILKYRLYDIDPVINKTIVIGAMVLVITAGYVAVVLGVGALVPAGRGVLWLITTAIVAVLSEPLRRRAQRVADRLVYGHRTTPYEALAQLTAGLHGAPENLLAGIATTVANAVGAREVVVWVGDENRLVPAAAWPAAVDDPARALPDLYRPGWQLRPVAHHGTVLGALALRKPTGESLTVAEDRLLADLVAQTALVIVQQRHAEQLQAAARRIVTAEDVARRRIERNLHDGAQQRLLTLGLELGALAERATADPALAARVRGRAHTSPRRDRRAARPRTRVAPHGPHRARARSGARGARRSIPRARQVVGGVGRSVADRDRGDNLFPHQRGAHKRRPPRRRPAGDRVRDKGRRRAQGEGVRRRLRRCNPEFGWRYPGSDRPARGARCMVAAR